MSRYITTEYNYGSMIPSAAQIAARVSTLHNGLRPVTAAIIAESYGLQPSEMGGPWMWGPSLPVRSMSPSV